MRAFRLAVGTFVAQARDVSFDRLDADAFVNIVDQAQKVKEDVMENFENLKNSLDLDTDNNGSLSREELQAKVKWGLDPDTNNMGPRYGQHWGLDPEATQVAEQIFNELDMNGDNQVEMDEILEKLQELGTKFAAESQRVQQNILDGLSGSDFEETFKAAVSGMVEALEIDELSLEDFDKYFLNTVEQFPDSEAVAAKIRKLFYIWDTDKNGVVTEDEVKAAVEPSAQIFAEEAKDLISGVFH